MAPANGKCQGAQIKATMDMNFPEVSCRAPPAGRGAREPRCLVGEVLVSQSHCAAVRSTGWVAPRECARLVSRRASAGVGGQDVVAPEFGAPSASVFCVVVCVRSARHSAALFTWRRLGAHRVCQPSPVWCGGVCVRCVSGAGLQVSGQPRWLCQAGRGRVLAGFLPRVCPRCLCIATAHQWGLVGWEGGC